MKKSILFFISVVLLITALALGSCTDNQRAKNWGGTMEVRIPAGENFVNATFKDSDLWIITHNPTTDVYYMHEYSSFGVFEGTVVIKK